MLAAKQHKVASMPRGPKGEKRPADAIGNAVMIAKIATGEIEDITTEDGKNAAAVALGRMGGKARAKGMSAKRRKEIAKKAAKSRWGAANELHFDPYQRLFTNRNLIVGSALAILSTIFSSVVIRMRLHSLA